MRASVWAIIAGALSCAQVGCGPLAKPVEAAYAKRPNFLIIVADDLGYSDIGAFGGEIQTPNLDALAMSGLRLTDFHTAPTCSPTRAMLLTGADNHEVGLGAMSEIPRAMKPADAPGYEGYLTTRAASVAQLLRADGYHTLMAGKWHLGLEKDQSPAARGFERSFALLQGAHNHFGADQEGALKTLGGYSTYREDGELARFPRGAYSSDYFATRLIEFLDDTRDDDKPFFAYLAFTAPHWPLQAPLETSAKYQGRYDDGPQALRERRLARMAALGIVPANVRPYVPDDVKPWQAMTVQERTAGSRTMEVYAAMVDRMDQNIGRVIDSLRRSGRFDNTVIIFLSDNGAEGLPSLEPIVALIPQMQDTLAAYDHSPANIGRENSFPLYGPAWAQAAMSPYRHFKGYTTEGGIRSAAFIAGPDVAKGGQVISTFLHVMDIAPTLLDLAGLDQPVLSMRGRSWTPWLRGANPAVHDTRAVGWELSGAKAVRRGDWKAVYLVSSLVKTTKPRWALLNLKDDPGETRNLADEQPQKLQEMIEAWGRYAKEVGVAEPPQPAEHARGAGQS